jgi:CubicO group peptidase (beta-lactamase class C family)
MGHAKALLAFVRRARVRETAAAAVIGLCMANSTTLGQSVGSATTSATIADVQATVWARVDSLMAVEMLATRTPGAVLVAIRGDSIVYLKPFGVASVETGAPVTSDMIFRVASVTKMFTGLTASLLAERGQVDLSAPIGRYASDVAPALRGLTLTALLSHTAGLRDAFSVPGFSGAPTLADAARRLDTGAVLAPPATVYSYSNIGFMLAGYVLERASGLPYADLVTREVLGPLGMTHTTFQLTMAMTYPLALGHDVDANDPTRVAVMRPFMDSAELLPRGGLFSTAPDMALFAMALMNAPETEASRGLAPAAILRTMDVYATAPSDPVGGVPEQWYGLGMRITKYRGHREVGHFGGGVGYGAVVRLLPDRRRGVIILANRTNALLNGTADATIDALLGEDVPPDAAVAEEVAPARLSAAEARALAGRYRNAGDETLVFSMQGDELVLQDEPALRIQRVGPRTVAALAPDGTVILRFVTVSDRTDCIAYLFLFGRAFRHESVCPG